MRLLLPAVVSGRLVAALRQAGRREIGGILMGEHVGKNLFRIVECTVQDQGGTDSHFVRQAEAAAAALEQFARHHSDALDRFNYLGEWHSHPCHPLLPSLTDIRTMAGIVEDPETGANFAVLMLVRLGRTGVLEASARVYVPGTSSQRASLVLEQSVDAADDC